MAPGFDCLAGAFENISSWTKGGGEQMTQQEVRLGHPYFMYDAIMRQPQAWRKCCASTQPSTARRGRTGPEEAGPSGRYRHLLARRADCPTLFKKFAGATLSVEAWHSFEFCSYPPALDGDDAVIVISHRGTKTYSFLALETAKSRGRTRRQSLPPTPAPGSPWPTPTSPPWSRSVLQPSP